MGTCLSTGKNKGKISPSPAQSLRNLAKQGSKKPPRRSLSGKRIPGAEFPLPELEPPPQIFTLTAPRHLERPNAVTDDFVLDERHPLGLSSPFQACTCLATGDQHVYRKLYKDGQNLQQALSVQAELNVLQDVAPHPSLLAVHAIYDHEDVYCVVYNRWGSTMDLFDWVMSRQTGLPEAEAAHIMRQVLEVLVHLQSQGVLHRDVSLENLLVWPNPSIQHHMPTSLMNMAGAGGGNAQTLMAPRSPSSVPLLQSRPPPWDSDSHVPPAAGAGSMPRVMVTGLASAVRFKEGQALEGITGNSYYIAPEVIQGRHGKEAEVWACGVLLYIMLSGYPPFQGDDELEVFTSVLSMPPDFTEPPWPSISPAAQALVQSCLSHDAKARPTIRQLLDHPWVNNPPRALPGAVASKPSAAAAAAAAG